MAAAGFGAVGGTLSSQMNQFAFPKWTNAIKPIGAAIAVGVPLYVVLLVAYGASPRTTDVGYMPTQPVEYSHAMHVGKLGMDCRYCHNTVEEAAHAAIPPTQTCMNCHTNILPNSPKLLPVRESYATGQPIPWVRVHDLPDFVYFNHSAHVRRGVGCVECHGRIDKMERVYQAKMLSMGWCLDCHRNPGPRLRPADQITNMAWVPGEDPNVLGQRLMKQYNIRDEQYMTNCSICHR
jgi:hypothetical protein